MKEIDLRSPSYFNVNNNNNTYYMNLLFRLYRLLAVRMLCTSFSLEVLYRYDIEYNRPVIQSNMNICIILVNDVTQFYET